MGKLKLQGQNSNHKNTQAIHERINKVTEALTNGLASLWNNEQELMKSIGAQESNIRAMDRIFRIVFEYLAIMDETLKSLTGNRELNLDDDLITKTAESWYKEACQNAFSQVRKEITEEVTKLEQEEAKKQQTATIEEEIMAAEVGGLEIGGGGQGTPIPEGAEVFGGDQ